MKYQAIITANVVGYAKETRQSTYTVNFNNNGGTGTMANQDFVYGEPQNLANNEFTNGDRIFMRWNTEPDGSGTYYSAGQTVKNLVKTENGILDLYAIWSEKRYAKYEYEFNGTDYIDTGVYLFEEGTINRDFEISFEIVDQTAAQKSQATFISAMDESGSPWPGIVYRYNSGTTDHQIGANVNSNIKAEINYGNNITKVDIKRTNGVIYLKLNDGDFEQILDMSSLNKTFHVPLTFGASLKSDGYPQRQFKGILSNLYVEIF